MQIQHLQQYEQRPKTSFLIGQAFGDTLGSAGKMYLQGKMQNYFQGLQDERNTALEQNQRTQSARAYGSLTGDPGTVQQLMQIPASQHLNFMKEFGGGGISDLITGSTRSSGAQQMANIGLPANNRAMVQPINSGGQQEAPVATPASTATNIAQAQRMGITPEETPGVQRNVQGNADQQQQQQPQQVAWQAEQPVLPGGAIAPKTGRYNLGEMSDQEFNDVLNRVPGNTARKQLYDARLRQQTAMRDEEKLALSREGLEFKKSEAGRKSKEALIKRETEDSSKFLADIDESSEPLILQAGQLDQAMQAVKTGDVSGFYGYLTSKFGMDPLIPANVSRFASANKESYLNALKSTGSRLNQFLEKNILEASAKIGRSTASNMIILEQQKAENDIKMAKILKANELRDKYSKEYGYIPAKIGREVTEYQRKYAEHRFDVQSYRTQQILENEKKDDQLLLPGKSRSGSPLTLRMYDLLKQKHNGDANEALKEAKSLGYVILPEAVYAEQAKK